MLLIVQPYQTLALGYSASRAQGDERIPANDRPPPVHIERVTIDDKAAMPNEDMALSPGGHDLEIDYTALSLTIPERNQFRYMLEGRDTEWHEAGTRRQAVYTDLPPKAYRFRVIASNNDGVWNETGAAWSFRVLPAWYQTLWFRTAIVLLIGAVGAIVAVTTQRSRHRREQQSLTMRYESTLAERSRIAQELHDTLLQGFTGITIQLRAIQRVLNRRPDEGATALETTLTAADTALRDARTRDLGHASHGTRGARPARGARGCGSLSDGGDIGRARLQCPR